MALRLVASRHGQLQDVCSPVDGETQNKTDETTIKLSHESNAGSANASMLFVAPTGQLKAERGFRNKPVGAGGVEFHRL